MQSAKQTKLADVHLIKKRGRQKIAVVVSKSWQYEFVFYEANQHISKNLATTLHIPKLFQTELNLEIIIVNDIISDFLLTAHR